jgi:hypothetical protein
LKGLGKFVECVFRHFPAESAAVSTEQVVFEPRHVIELLAGQSLELENIWSFILFADSKESVAKLLEAVLGDWIDFFFIPDPASLAIFADHDEYVTFYSRSELLLADFASTLERAGFQSIPDWIRPAHWCWRDKRTP